MQFLRAAFSTSVISRLLQFLLTQPVLRSLEEKRTVVLDPSLKHLDLSSKWIVNRWGETEFDLLIDALETPGCRLKELYLHGKYPPSSSSSPCSSFCLFSSLFSSFRKQHH
jgi:hypothetical protein